MTFRRPDGREIPLAELPTQRALKSGETVRAEEIIIQLPDGQAVTTVINATPIFSEEGAVVSVVATVQDMTPLEDLQRLRAEFLGMVSHELRTPLTTIKGSAATLLTASSTLSPAEMGDFFRIIDEQADHMRSLISDLLDVTRIEAGTLSVTPEPTVVAALVDQAREVFLRGGARNSIEVDLPPDLPRIGADRQRIMQVLTNLLSNASKYSRDKSAIRVSASVEDVYVAISDDAGPFKSVSAGGLHTCGVMSDGSVACWGSNRDLQGIFILGQATPPGGSFESVSAGFEHNCGVRSDGSVACWGSDSWGRATPPGGSFESVSAGIGQTCGVRSDGSVACWGSDSWGQATPPEGSFDSVSAGGGLTCGVRSDGSVACWGSDSWGRATPPAGSFDSVSAGGLHTCGVRSDGSVACWGSDSWGQATPPEGSFDSVSAGGWHTCGVRSDGSVACWGRGVGNDDYGQATPPAGSFESVSAGGWHTCGVRSDGSVACWGNSAGRATPPAGSFESVSAGGGLTCGVRSDGSVACWGSNGGIYVGRAAPPAGSFESVSAGGEHICGVRSDGSVACWGADYLGQATPPGE